MPLPVLKPLNYTRPLHLSSCSEKHTETSCATKRAAAMVEHIGLSSAVSLIHYYWIIYYTHLYHLKTSSTYQLYTFERNAYSALSFWCVLIHAMRQLSEQTNWTGSERSSYGLCSKFDIIGGYSQEIQKIHSVLSPSQTCLLEITSYATKIHFGRTIITV